MHKSVHCRENYREETNCVLLYLPIDLQQMLQTKHSYTNTQVNKTEAVGMQCSFDMNIVFRRNSNAFREHPAHE